MLTNPREIEIISNARQANVRNPQRSRAHFEHIFADFLKGARLNGRYLDLGAGQYDFGQMIRAHGGSCVGADNDPAVLELGAFKEFETVDIEISKLDPGSFSETFDGIFNKFSFSAFWFPDDDRHRQFVEALASYIKPGGWAWLAPWNGVPKGEQFTPDQINHMLEVQDHCFAENGFDRYELNDAQSRRYGVHGHVANNVVFTRNLDFRPARTSFFLGRLHRQLNGILGR